MEWCRGPVSQENDKVCMSGILFGFSFINSGWLMIYFVFDFFDDTSALKKLRLMISHQHEHNVDSIFAKR